MIQANEIRVGNMFIGYDDKPFVWGLKEFSFIEPDVNISIDEIIKSPVLISEEILLNVGFVIAEDKYKGYLSPQFRGMQRIRIRKTNSGNFIYQLNKKTNPLYIQYLHQLQNLYFALTGSELDVSKLI